MHLEVSKIKDIQKQPHPYLLSTLSHLPFISNHFYQPIFQEFVIQIHIHRKLYFYTLFFFPQNLACCMYSLAYVVCLCVRVQSGNYPLLACRVCSHSFLLLHKQSFVFEMCQLIIQFLMEGNLDCFQSSVITVSDLVNDDEYKEFHKDMIIPFLYRICQIALCNG